MSTVLVSSSAAVATPESSAISDVARTVPSDGQLAIATDRELVRLLVRCTSLAGETYCLHVGFTDEDVTAAEFWDRLSVPQQESQTGGGTFISLARAFAALPERERRKADIAEIRNAFLAVGSYKFDKLVGAGQRPDEAFLAEYPEMRPIAEGAQRRQASMPLTATTTTYDALPSSVARRQVASYYCGPASFQMIEGSNTGSYESQDYWAGQLGTTTSGTSITSMVSLINSRTSWDSRAGTYKVTSVAGMGTDTYWSLITNQIGFQGSPVLEHPLLLNAYYDYLSTTGGYGGHFQVGKGYRADSAGVRYVRLFEPYNEPDWTGYTVATWGPQEVRAGKALDGNQANTGFKNIGI